MSSRASRTGSATASPSTCCASRSAERSCAPRGPQTRDRGRRSSSRQGKGRAARAGRGGHGLASGRRPRSRRSLRDRRTLSRRAGGRARCGPQPLGRVHDGRGDARADLADGPSGGGGRLAGGVPHRLHGSAAGSPTARSRPASGPVDGVARRRMWPRPPVPRGAVGSAGEPHRPAGARDHRIGRPHGARAAGAAAARRPAGGVSCRLRPGTGGVRGRVCTAWSGHAPAASGRPAARPRPVRAPRGSSAGWAAGLGRDPILRPPR